MILWSLERLSNWGLSMCEPPKSLQGAGVAVSSDAYLWKVDTEGVHVHAVEKASKALGEARQALMHQLQLDKIRLEVGHGVAELGEAILKALERVSRRCCATTALDTVA
jgi:hypothetical protein